MIRITFWRTIDRVHGNPYPGNDQTAQGASVHPIGQRRELKPSGCMGNRSVMYVAAWLWTSAEPKSVEWAETQLARAGRPQVYRLPSTDKLGYWTTRPNNINHPPPTLYVINR